MTLIQKAATNGTDVHAVDQHHFEFERRTTRSPEEAVL